MSSPGPTNHIIQVGGYEVTEAASPRTYEVLRQLNETMDARAADPHADLEGALRMILQSVVDLSVIVAGFEMDANRGEAPSPQS